MKFICPSGAGWLMRAVMCGLLAAIVIPGSASAQAITLSSPFSGVFTNDCIVPAEAVTVSGIVTTTTISQPDGSLASYVSLDATGVTLGGVKYSTSRETHTWLFGPDSTTMTIYDYRKFERQGETSAPVGGDDFYLRVFVQIPVQAGGPSPNSLSTSVTGACR
jgi:hypothetical protein